MKATKETIIRTIICVIALINQIMSATGHPILQIEDEMVETTVTVIITVVTWIWSFWKNNSFTKEAVYADKVMHDLKETRGTEHGI